MNDIILTKEKIFNNETLNIFTDASIITIRDKSYIETIGCPGCYVIGGDTELELNTQILRNSTNNNSEITAIFMGVLAAQKYRSNYRYINLFSDSKISVLGLREWIFNWANGAKDGVMYSSSGKPVANQSIFLQIIYFIINNNLNINLFHVNGHINPTNIPQLLEAKKTFITSNHINIDVDEELIALFAKFNDVIDKATRQVLYDNTFSPMEKTNPFIKYFYQPFDINTYNHLIGGISNDDAYKQLQADIFDIANAEDKNHRKD